MLTEMLSLDDGTAATMVRLGDSFGTPSPIIAAAYVGNSVWTLQEGGTFAVVRNAETAEIIHKVDILEEAVTLASAPSHEGTKVWVSTKSHKVYIFAEQGSLLGLLQASGNPSISKFFPVPKSCGDVLFSCGSGKDISLWDSKKYTVIRTFFGPTPGETVQDVTPCDNECAVFAVASTHGLYIWGRQQASVLATIQQGATSVFVDFEFEPFQAGNQMTTVAYVWAAHPSAITVYALNISPPKHDSKDRGLPDFSLAIERVLPCPMVQKIACATHSHITATANDGMVTVWERKSLRPIRTFTIKGRPLLSLPTLAKESRLIWTVQDGNVVLWKDEEACDVGGTHTIAAPSQSTPQVDSPKGVAKDMEKEEITFLRRKLKYLETMSSLYRQKVGVLFRDAAPSDRSKVPSGLVSTFNEVDMAYREALDRYEQQTLEQEPLPEYLVTRGDGRQLIGQPPADAAAEEFIDFWKQRYHNSVADMVTVKKEHESMIELFFSMSRDDGVSNKLQSDADVQRAQHVCQLIKEKNALRERERQLTDDVSKLRAKLREFSTPLASRGPREDPETLKAQNDTLRQEVKSLQKALDESTSMVQSLQTQAKQAQLFKTRLAEMQRKVDTSSEEMSLRTESMQGDIDKLVVSHASVTEKLKATESKWRTAESKQKEAEIMVVRKQQLIENLQQQVSELTLALEQQKKASEAAIEMLKAEIKTLCDAVEDRDKKIVEWQNMYEDVCAKLRATEMENESLKYIAQSLKEEIGVLTERVQHLQSVLQDRKDYADTLGEVQGRMELIIEELRNAFTPHEFATSVGKLEERMGSLLHVEQQLKHKDDIIGMKDDELSLVRENASALEHHVRQVSSVFLQLPHSVAEVEAMLIEVDEYRRRLGMDSDVQSSIRHRVLALQAKRKTGVAIDEGEVALQLPSKDTSPDEEALARAKVLADTIKGVLNGVDKVNKGGLVGSQPQLPYPLNPVHQHRELPVAEDKEPVASPTEQQPQGEESPEAQTEATQEAED